MANLSLSDFLELHFKNFPQATFLTSIESQHSYSYADLHSAVVRYCNFIALHNLNKDDRIIFLAQNNWNIFPLIIACSITGCILIPISPDLHTNEIERIVEDVKPSIVLIDATTSINYIFKIKMVCITEIDIIPQNQSDIKSFKAAKTRDQPILIIYTSGTSGQCKGVMISEFNIIHAASSIIKFYKITNKDRLLCVLPLYHMNAIMVTGIVPFLAGASILLSSIFSFKNASLYFERVRKYNVTILSVIPSILSIFLKLFPQGLNLASWGVKFCFCGAAPLSKQLWQQFETSFCINVYQGYGLTETTFWATLTPTDASKDYSSVGIPHNCYIKIKSKDQSNIGEVMVAGPIVTKGYYNRKTEFHGDFFPTGDIGYFGSNNQLYIIGRIKDIIIKNGINIFPQEIDNVIKTHKKIEDCATLGIDDEIAGQLVCSVCVPSQKYLDLSEIEIKAFVKDKLSAYMIPDIVLFTNNLPRGNTGKIIKKHLVDFVTDYLKHKSMQELSY